MKGLRKILRVSWTAKKTNEWVLNKAGVKRELLDIVKARKLAYYGHTMRKPDDDFLAIFCVLYFQRAARSTLQTCILNLH